LVYTPHYIFQSINRNSIPTSEAHEIPCPTGLKAFMLLPPSFQVGTETEHEKKNREMSEKRYLDEEKTSCHPNFMIYLVPQIHFSIIPTNLLWLLLRIVEREEEES
jgi:hypothetical protein